MKEYLVLLHPQAERDIDKAKTWWEERDSSWADMIDDALEAVSRRLSQFPELGHPVQIRGAWSMTTRSFVLGETGYVLRYTIDHDHQQLIVTRFRHEKRKPLNR